MVMELGDRARGILFAIVDDFLRTGIPIGSRTISKKKGIDVSPATIRNIMSDLEESGLLAQPHTSAGRVPTDRALRFYVDSLVEIKDISEDEERQIIGSINPANMELRDMVRETSRVLAKISHYASVVMTPRFTDNIFKYIDFIKLSDNRILIILVSQTGMIHNKIIFDDADMSADKLGWMARYLNDILADLTLHEVRRKILEEMRNEKNLYDSLLMRALSISKEVVEDEIKGEEIFVEGSTYVFDYPEFADIEKMKQLFETFENKHNLLKLLDKVAKAEGIKIFIGSESRINCMSGCALIASPYRRGDQILGSIGVIGPTRMNYERVIPIVNFTANLINTILDDI